ncbi:MAG: transcriptional regulator [Chryseolinea sp.]
MMPSKFDVLDPILNTPVRLAIMSVLLKLKQADFNTLMEVTETTQGNMSHQLKKLSEEEYIAVEKTFKGSYPLTICKITPKGRKAFETYVCSIKQYLHL